MSNVRQERSWSNLPTELLRDIIQRVEKGESSWPGRKHVVACASVCSSWRDITREIVKPPEISGCITFSCSLKQPGPRGAPIQCFIRRDRTNSSYQLYLGLPPSPVEAGKFLLAARKCRRATSTDYVISLDSDEFSRGGNNYVGKIKSNFLGTRFTIFDSNAPFSCTGVSVMANHKSGRRVALKQVSPKVPAGSYKVADISYELNVLGTRGPRRMHCILHSIPLSAMCPGGSVPNPGDMDIKSEYFFEESSSVPSSPVAPRARISAVADCSSAEVEWPKTPDHPCSSEEDAPLVLKNKAPRWHEQLQCWCLNFKGRVTVASVKNFQLVASDQLLQIPPTSSSSSNEDILLQFGKIGKDMFTMDYRYPLSAFQAFAICLSSFDNKLACE